jgi:hypothetical protein
MMKINRPFIMVALVGSKEDAQTNTNHLSADWKLVTGNKALKKLNKKGQLEISKSERVNQSAMRVFVKTAEKKKITDKEEKDEKKIKSVPHKPSNAEALKKKKEKVIKSKKASFTSKEFSNKKFQKLLDQGVKDLKDSYKIPCISQKVRSLCVDIKQTLKYLVKQLEFYDMLKDIQILRLPKYFRPYEELHFKKAFDGKLPDNLMDNPKHIFHIFHTIGRQKRYTSSYKAHLHQLVSHMILIFNNQEDYDDEKYKFDAATKWFFGIIEDQIHEDEKMHIYNNKTQKTNKNQQNKKTHNNFTLKTAQGGRYQCNIHHNDGHYFYPLAENQDDDIPNLIDQDAASQSMAGYDSDQEYHDEDDIPYLVDQSISTAQYDSEDAFSLSNEENDNIILECAFGAQVTFIDDNNNVANIGDGEDVDGNQDTFPGTELSNISIRNSNSDMSEDTQEQVVNSDEVKQVIMDDDTKPAALLLNRPDNASPKNAISAPKILNKSNVSLAPKVPPST